METLIDAIRAAISDGAPPEARTAGASACRTILAALEAKAGQPIAAPTPVSQSPATAPPIAAIGAALRGLPADQLLDLAIAKLRAMVPADQQPAVRGIQIPIVPPRKP